MKLILLVIAAYVAATLAAPAKESKAISIVSRSQWGARPPKSVSKLSKPLSYVFIHHSAGSEPATLAAGKTTMRSIQNYHMDSNGWADIGYSFLIGGDGSIFEGRGWDNLGAHTSGYNGQGYGICFMGTFTNKSPTTAAINAAKNLIQEAVSRGALRSNYKLKGHRQMGATACPGNSLFNLIKTWPNFSA